jgi:hypothetical protein
MQQAGESPAKMNKLWQSKFLYKYTVNVNYLSPHMDDVAQLVRAPLLLFASGNKSSYNAY